MSSIKTTHQKILLLLYPGSISFETMLAVEILGKNFPVDIVTSNDEIHTDQSGLKIAPHLNFDAVEIERYAALLVPGGNPDAIIGLKSIQQLIQRFDQMERVIGGICAGVLVLADSGILRGHAVTHNYTPKYAPDKVVELTNRFWNGIAYTEALAVTSGRIVTAMPNGYIDFATQLALLLGVCSKEQAARMNRYYRGQSA